MIFKPISHTYKLRQQELLLDAAKLNGPTMLHRPDSPLQELVRSLRKLLQPWSATRRDGLTMAGT